MSPFDTDDDFEVVQPSTGHAGVIVAGLLLAALLLATSLMDRWMPTAWGGRRGGGDPRGEVEFIEPSGPILRATIEAIPPPRAFVGPEGTPCWSTANKVRVRTKPSTRAKIVTRVQRWQVMRCIEPGEEWRSVLLLDGQVGYVSSGLVTDESPPVADLLSAAKSANRPREALDAWSRAVTRAWERSEAWSRLTEAYIDWARRATREAVAAGGGREAIRAEVECNTNGPTDESLYAAFHLLKSGKTRRFDHPDLFIRDGRADGIWSAFRLEGVRLRGLGGRYLRLDGPGECTVRLDAIWSHDSSLPFAVRYALGLGLLEGRLWRRGS